MLPSYSQCQTWRTDTPPGYSHSVNHSYVVYRKLELSSPFHVAKSRAWRPVLLNVNGTQLRFHEFQSSKVEACLDLFFRKIDYFVEQAYIEEQLKLLNCEFRRESQDTDAVAMALRHNRSKKAKFEQELVQLDSMNHLQVFRAVAETYKLTAREQSALEQLIFHGQRASSAVSGLVGPFESAYTLQHCKIGKALDYKKKGFVMRLRVELAQMLVKVVDLKRFVEVYGSIVYGGEVALPLEQMYHTKKRTLPRRQINGSSAHRHARRGSDSSVDSQLADPLPDSPKIQFAALNKHNLYSVKMVERMDFYTNYLRQFNFLKPDFQHFQQVSSWQHNRFTGSSATLSGKSSISSQLTGLSLPTTVGSSIGSVESPEKPSYDYLNEVELFDVIYEYKCVRSLKRADKWSDCFVVVSSGSTESRPGKPGKPSLFSKMKKRQQCADYVRYGIQPFISRQKPSVGLPDSLDSFEDFQALESTTSEYFRHCLKHAVVEPGTVSSSKEKLLFVDGNNVMKFLKALKSNKLGFLNSTSSEFCKTFMILEDGIIGWS